MKKLFFILVIAAFSFKSLLAADVVLNDFEAGSPAVSVAWGGSYANVANPVSSGINTTAKCEKVGRTANLYYEGMQFNTANSYSIPASTKRYVHIMVNCAYQAIVRIQVNKTAPYVAPINLYVGNGTWQDLVFEVTGAVTTGTTIASLYVFCDYGTGANGTGVLNNTTKFAYIDEIIANDSYAPRGVTALTTISDFEAATFAAPITSAGSYATSGYTWSAANPASDAVNSSAKCYQVIKVSPDPIWTGLQLSLGYFSTINSSNQYLHVMVYKTVASQIGFQYSFGNGTQSTASWDNSQTSIINQWTDYVYQIPIGTVFKQLNVEILAATGTFYMDNMELNSSPTPRGGVTYMTDNNLCDFESDIASSTTIRDVANMAVDANNIVSYPVTNPFNTAANTTANAGKRTRAGLANGVNWYTGISFSLMKPMLIDASHKYLHVLVSAPADGQVVNFGFKQGANLLTDVPKTVTKANIWQDMVVDLSAMAFISDVFVKCGAAGATAAGDYYFDEIKINGDPTPSSDVVVSLTNGNPTMGGISGAGTFTKGVSTTVTATPNSGYRFVNWTLNTSGGAVQSTLASYPFTVSSAVTLVANFIQQFAVSASAGTGGSITSGAGTYDSGATATVIAAADAGYRFVNWTLNTSGGAVQSTLASYPFTVSGAETLVANFVQVYVIGASPNNGAMGSVSGASTYDTGASVSLTATVNSGYHFVNWTQSGSEVSTSATYTFTASADRTLVANFASNTQNISGATNADASILNNCSQCDITVQSGGILTINIPKAFNSLTVAPGARLTLNSEKTLNVAGALTLQSSASGTATFVDENTTSELTLGSSTVQQYVGSSRNWYMSSPVSGAAALPTVDSGTLTFYSYPENDSRQAAGVNGVYAAGAVWNSVSSGTMTVGTGYIVHSSASTPTITFSGTGLNAGNQTISGLTYTSANPKHGFNLIGNPYPSYLNVLPSITANTQLDATVWYRTRDTNETPLYHFETVNATTGVGTNASLTGRVTGYIPPMQGFWIRTKSNNQSITLSNTNRSHELTDVSMTGYANTPTTPLKAPAMKNQVYTLLGLNVSNGTYGDETILMFVPEATSGLDAYDSGKMNNNNASIPEIYTVVGGEQVAINCSNSIQYDTEMQLGFTTGTAGTFSIKASQFSNFDAGTKVILKDYLDINNPVIADLSDGSSYTFSSAITSNNNSRFALVFRAPSIATDINPESIGNVWISTRNGQIVVNCTANRTTLEIFNIVGQKVISRNLTGTFAQLNNSLATGTYLVKLTTEGKSITRKIIID